MRHLEKKWIHFHKERLLLYPRTQPRDSIHLILELYITSMSISERGWLSASSDELVKTLPQGKLSRM